MIRLTKERFIAIGLACYVVLLLINRYQAMYLNSQFDIIQKYTNIFTLGLTSSFFVVLILHHYGKVTSAVSKFVGSRTFGIYILQFFPMRLLDCTIGVNRPAIPPFPDGSGMLPVIAMVYLLAVIALSMLALTLLISMLERVPYVKKLLFQ